MRKARILTLVMALMALTATAFAADVYFSVGTDGGDLNADASVSVSGGTALFSSDQPANIGAGDRVTYNGGSVMYIRARLSALQFSVGTATGGAVANGGPWAVNSVTRAFTTLNNAVNTAATPNPSDAAYLDTNDLTSGPYTLNIICYGDANADTTSAVVSGWVTDATSSVNIRASDEFRKKGRWDAGAYRLVITSGDALAVSSDHVRIFGLQVELSGSGDDGIVSSVGNDDVTIAGNIVRYSGPPNPIDAIGIYVDDGNNAGIVAKVYNNIVYGFLGTNNSGIAADFTGAGSKAYIYNNTLTGNTVGLNDVSGQSSIVAKNMLCFDNGDNYGGSGTFDAASANNLSGLNTDADVPSTNAQNGVNVRFIDAANGDYRLAARDAGAQDNGANLSADAGLNFSADVEGQVRGRLWDIGADERAPRALSVLSATDPVVIRLGDGTVAEDFQLTFTNAWNGLDGIQKGGYGTSWGEDLVPAGTLFTIGGESGAATHAVITDSAAGIVVRKTRTGVTSLYHIYPTGRIVLDAAGATSVSVNQTGTFTEYADGTAHAGGYHAYADIAEDASSASADLASPDSPSVITGARVTDRSLDYNSDGYEEGAGVYTVMASAGSATLDFNGNTQARYAPVITLDESYPRTQPGATLRFYWDAADTTKSGNEVWGGTLVSTLSPVTGLRGGAMSNSSSGKYAAVQTLTNIADPGTLSAWVRSSSPTNPSAVQYVLFADSNFNIFYDASGRINFRVDAAGVLTDASDTYDNRWHRVTCTWDYASDTYALYVDGKRRAVSTSAYAAPTYDLTMYMTAMNVSGGNRFTGDIDEIRIYNGVVKPTGHALFHSRLDGATDMTAPQVGSAGAVGGSATFPAGARGNALLIDASGEYATLPSAGNISAGAGTLEMQVRSLAAGNPSVSEQLFFGGAGFQLFFDANGRVNFTISAGVNLTDAVDTYDAQWHHVKVMWDYTNDRYFLYVDGRQAAASTSAYAAPALDATMHLGAADASDTNRYNGQIDELYIYDAALLPFGAFNAPLAWGDATGRADASLLLYWDADSSVLNTGSGSATLGGGLTVGSGIVGSGLVNDAAGEFASLPSAGNIVGNEGSLGFWFKSAGAGSPSGAEYLLYAGADFNVYLDTSGYLNHTISGGVTLQHAADVYDAGWHHARCTWDYANDIYELYVDGARSDSTGSDYAAPALDTDIYVSARNNSGANRFNGSMDELYAGLSRAMPQTATAFGAPVVQPQAGSAYGYRVDVGPDLSGLDAQDLLTPSSDFVASAGLSPSAYTLQYLGAITTTGRPSITSVSGVQGANNTLVTVSFTGTDPDNDTVTYVAADCEYSRDSTNGIDGNWAAMSTSESTEAFTSIGASRDYIWNAAANESFYDGAVFVRLRVRDGIGHESPQAASTAFSVDTLDPAGLGNFRVSAKATTMLTLAWDAVTDHNWLNQAHYEIWYGTVRTDVQNRTGFAKEWDNTRDAALATSTTATTTVTGLTANTTYFLKIWAVDGYGNEATLADISDATNASTIQRLNKVQIDPIYDAANDAILVTTSLLTRSGALVTDLTDLFLTYIGIFDSAGTNLSSDLSGTDDTVSGMSSALFYTTWDPDGGLTPDTSYTIVAKISYKGQDYSGVKSISVDETSAAALQIDLIKTKTDILESTTVNFDSQLTNFVIDLDEHEEEQVTFRDTRQEEYDTVETQVGTISEGTADLTEFVEEELGASMLEGVQAELITRETTVVLGSRVPIRFRDDTGLSPTISIYDPRDVQRVVGAPMTELGSTGIYTYDVDFRTTWGIGEFTVVVREPLSQAMDSVQITVVNSLTTGGGSSGGTAASSSGITTDLIYSRLSSMDGDISSLVDDMGGVGDVTGEVTGSLDELLGTLGLMAGTREGGGFDAQTISGMAGAIGTVIGEEGDAPDAGTVLGRIALLEGQLAGIGKNAKVASEEITRVETKAKTVRQMALRVQELLDNGEIDEAQGLLLALGTDIEQLKEDCARVPDLISIDALAEEMQGMVGQINEMAAEKGIADLIPAFDATKGTAVDPEVVMEARNDVSELRSLIAEVKSFLDQEINKPIIHAWLEAE